MRVEVIGSGVVGLCAAHVFAARGSAVRVVSESDGADPSCCSWWAGGMLAPFVECESAEPLIGDLGAESLAFWRARVPRPVEHGTLVVATARDLPDLRRFGRMTEGWERLDAGGVAALEPDLAGRFGEGLFYGAEAHFDPREVLPRMRADLAAAGVVFERRRVSGEELAAPPTADWRIDCRGLAARDALPDLRGVKGEMLLIRSGEIGLSRPVRLIHPRIPLYVTPRADGVYMIGATMIEASERRRATARSVLELLSAAYALHPGFGEAEILEIGVDARPAFPDNLPRLRQRGRTIHVNGMYRHGFLCAPAMARRAADLALEGRHFPEVMDEDHDQRRSA